MAQLKNAKIIQEGDKLFVIDAPEITKWMNVHPASIRFWKEQGLHCPDKIPMTLLNEKMAERNHSQSLIRLNERGGLSIAEIAYNINERELQFKGETNAELNFVINAMQKYKEEALSKAPRWEVKNKKEVIELLKELYADPRFEHPLNWQPEQGKLYDLPKNIEFEIKGFCQACHNVQMINCAHFDNCNSWKKFAFIKEQKGFDYKARTLESSFLIPQAEEVRGDKKELQEIIAKVHDDIEGRYELDSYDKGIIHSLLCKLQ